MKYKILITGKNDSIIGDFFAQMVNEFEVMTTSSRYDDIVRHVKYFQPDIFVCCIYNESRDTIAQIINAKYRLSEAHIPVALIGAKEECDEFEKIAVNVANLTLYRPISVANICSRIGIFMEGRRALKEETAQAGPTGGGLDLDSLMQELTSGAATRGADPAAKDGARKHVLVVDDNSMMLKLIKEHLHEKYDVATAVSGKIALKFLERKKTDLILLDYEMPGENGPAVLEQLRASDETKDIPVVFLTGVTEKKKIAEVLVLKPQSYLLKPIDREKLLSTIEKIIG